MKEVGLVFGQDTRN